MSADRIGADASTAGELAAQYWHVMERTADLVRQLTALADRYDDSGRDSEGDRRAAVALMRTTAEAGRRLIRSLAPPAFTSGEQQPLPTSSYLPGQAHRRDERAAGRDAAAETRDERAAQRDARERAATGDDDLAFPARFLAACDRDDAAGDRADALGDRRAARADRDRTRTPLGLHGQAEAYAVVTRLEERVHIRQAQGVLMERAGMTAGEAFEALLLASGGPLTLDEVADHVLLRAELPTPQGHGIA